MTTERQTRDGPQEIFFGGNPYIIDGDVDRFALPDWARPVPISGQQDAQSRYLRESLVLGAIVNAFGPRVIGGWDQRDPISGIDYGEHLRQGRLNVLRASTQETRFGERTLASLENTPSMPTDAGISWVAGPSGVAGGARASTVTRGNKNPRQWVYVQGEGVKIGRIDEAGDNDYDLDILTWTGTAFTEANISEATTDEADNILDFTLHNGELTYIYRTASGTQVAATSGAYSNDPASTLHIEGTRLVSDGATLYAFIQENNTLVDVASTGDAGATAWDARVTGFTGVLRDVWRFTIQTSSGEEAHIIVLMEDALYWYDTTNHVFVHLLSLPFAGRGLNRWGDELLIFLDAGRVLAYHTSGALRDVSPGGPDGMPSGFDFGQDNGGQVCLAESSFGVYALWSGLDTGGSAQKPLCLMFDGRGWHYIWQKADTSISGAARFIFVDPTTNDLVFGVQDAISEGTGLYQLKDIDVNPRLLASNAEFAAAGYGETPLLVFPPTAISTTMWDTFYNTEDVDADETITPSYGINGAVATTTAQSALTSNRATTTYGSGLGVNFTTVRFRDDLARGATTSNSPKVVNTELNYLKVPDVRWGYSFRVNVVATHQAREAASRGEPVGIRNELETTLDSKVKVTLRYGDRSVSVLPIAEAQLRERILRSVGMDTSGGESVPSQFVVVAAEV